MYFFNKPSKFSPSEHSGIRNGVCKMFILRPISSSLREISDVILCIKKKKEKKIDSAAQKCFEVVRGQ